MFDNVTVGQLAILFGTFTAIVKGFDWIMERFIKPKFQKETAMTDIEKEIKEIAGKLDKDYSTLKDHDKRIMSLESRIGDIEEDRIDVHEALHVLVVGQQAVTKSLLEDGNNKVGLRNAELELEKYLTSKV